MKQLTLAVDFDGTLVEEGFHPEIGPIRKNAKEVINKLHEDGHYIIIWTCRTLDVDKVAEFLNQHQIKFHAINEEHPETMEKWGYSSRKIGASYYIDDRGIGGLPSWNKIYKIINRKANDKRGICTVSQDFIGGVRQYYTDKRERLYEVIGRLFS